MLVAMPSKRLTPADRLDTWDEGWQARLAAQVAASGAADMWEYIRRRPHRSYGELAEELAARGGFGVAPIQVERLQVRDTPEPDLRRSLRDSLARHLQATLPWGQGPYWESRVLAALVSWADPWSARVDVSAFKHRLFEVDPPVGWTPAGGDDPVLRVVVPDSDPTRT
jgi:hypothetical protein